MKGQSQTTKQRPLFVAFPFLSTALVGTLTTIIIATHASNTAQMASVGVCLSIVAAGLVSLIKQHAAAAEDRFAEMLTNLQPALSLAGDSADNRRVPPRPAEADVFRFEHRDVPHT